MFVLTDDLRHVDLLRQLKIRVEHEGILRPHHTQCPNLFGCLVIELRDKPIIIVEDERSHLYVWNSRSDRDPRRVGCHRVPASVTASEDLLGLRHAAEDDDELHRHGRPVRFQRLDERVEEVLVPQERRDDNGVLGCGCLAVDNSLVGLDRNCSWATLVVEVTGMKHKTREVGGRVLDHAARRHVWQHAHRLSPVEARRREEGTVGVRALGRFRLRLLFVRPVLPQRGAAAGPDEKDRRQQQQQRASRTQA
mmetsp:Transcript_53245/g.151720  ORF Transcript_53245/g.151720 Transcript_53245/m.151720 type:complete len:251 (-) Transcript_53245:58-810(-)